MLRNKTNHTAPFRRSKGEVNTLPSLTIPDQAVSPQELLRRFATGQPLGFTDAQAVYDDNEGFDVPEFYKMDALDRLHYMQENAENVFDAKNAHDVYVNNEREKQRLAEQDKQAEALNSERKTTNSVAKNDE